jgi:hypothetical protein
MQIVFTVVFILALQLSKCEWITSGNYSLNITGNIYKISCTAGATISGTLSWSDHSDLDIWIFR